MKMTETGKRVAVAVVGVPLALAIVYVGGWLLAVVTGVLAVLAALEFFRLADAKSAHPMKILGATLSACFVALAAFAPDGGPGPAGFGVFIMLGVLATAAFAIWDRGVEGEPLRSISTTLTGVLYTGGLLSFWIFLRYLPGTTSALHATILVFVPVVLTWTSDTCAYFVGRAWGTRKLTPRISPGKTVQGAIGALVGSVVVAVAYTRLLALFPAYRIEIPQAILLGLAISIAAQIGDLVESLLKRDAGLKDSGAFFPGHGGILDRFDSLLFTLPLAYLLLLYWIGPVGGVT